MHKALCALSLLLCSGAACAQTVTDQSVGGLMFVTDSSGEILEATFPVIDPTVAPAGLSLLVENDEPLSSFNPTYHTVSLDADLDSTGSNWSGSGTSAAHYADALDLSVDYGGSNIPAATAIFSHNVYFTVDFPTTVDVNTNFLIQMTDTFNPVFFANNFRLQFRDSNNNTVYSTGFDNTQLGVPQQQSDSFVLAPGDYRFDFSLFLNTQEQLGFRDGSIDFSYDVSFVPAPATAVLLIGGAFVGTSRRR